MNPLESGIDDDDSEPLEGLEFSRADLVAALQMSPDDPKTREMLTDWTVLMEKKFVTGPNIPPTIEGQIRMELARFQLYNDAGLLEEADQAAHDLGDLLEQSSDRGLIAEVCKAMGWDYDVN